MRAAFFTVLLVCSLALAGSTPAAAQSTELTDDDVRDIIANDPTDVSLSDIRAIADWVRESTLSEVSETLYQSAGEWLGLARETRANVVVNSTENVTVEDPVVLNRTIIEDGDGRTPTDTPTVTPTDTAERTPTPTTSASTPTPIQTSQSGDTASSTAAGERIDSQTTIVSSEYRENESVALVTLRSSAAQAITLSDAGAFAEGGEVPVRSVALGAGETATIEVPVTERDGMVGVAISTENTALYAEIIRQPRSGDGGLDALRAVAPLTAWILGILIAFVWMTIAGWSVLRGEDSRPEVA